MYLLTATDDSQTQVHLRNVLSSLLGGDVSWDLPVGPLLLCLSHRAQALVSGIGHGAHKACRPAGRARAGGGWDAWALCWGSVAGTSAAGTPATHLTSPPC